MEDNIEVVCTNEEAREYFKNKGLTYGDVTYESILILCIYLSQELKKSHEIGETTVNSLRVSKKQTFLENSDGEMISAYIYIDSNYFKEREGISFEGDGFIGIAGWADLHNLNPIKRAFLRWCDNLADKKREVAKTGE